MRPGRAGLEPGRYVSLKVRDTGTGMPQEVITRLSSHSSAPRPKPEEPAWVWPPSTASSPRPAVTWQILPELGLGTVVTILLPATSPAAVAPGPSKKQAPPQRCGGGTVLPVEDEAALREVTQRILARDGYDVITAVNGRRRRGGQQAPAATSTCSSPTLLCRSWREGRPPSRSKRSTRQPRSGLCREHAAGALDIRRDSRSKGAQPDRKALLRSVPARQVARDHVRHRLTPARSQEWGRWDSNPHCNDPKSFASCRWATTPGCRSDA